MRSKDVSLAVDPAAMQVFLGAVAEFNVSLRLFPKCFELILELFLLTAHLILEFVQL